MLDTLLSGAYAPFTLSIALLFGLLALELVFAIMGATLLGAGGADPDVEIDLPGVADAPDFDLEIDLDGIDIDPAEFEISAPDDIAGELDAVDASSGGLASWLGLGKVPALIWIASLLLGFGLAGILIQNAAAAVWAPLPAALAVIPAGAIGIWFARSFGRVFARILPKTETQAVSKRSLGRRAGTVTQGTARRGQPAEVRVNDRYGNTHYLRAEPMQDGEEISEGAEVLVLRHRPTGGFRLIPLND
ncbi:MAG: OB-fold-containig protein [Pseudomonadota bacterium]